MARESKKAANRVLTAHIPSALALLAVSVAVFLYMDMAVNPVLIHYAQQPFFRLGGAFLSHHLSYAGGPVEYAAAFLGLFLRFDTAGAALFTLAFLGTCGLWRCSLRRFGMPSGAVRYLLPAFFLTWIHSNYEAPLTATLGMGIALSFFLGLLWMAAGPFWLLNLAFLLMAGALYYLCGAPVVLFLGLYLLHLLFDETVHAKSGALSRLLAGAFAVFSVALLPALLNALFFHEMPVHAYVHLAPWVVKHGAIAGIGPYCEPVELQGRALPPEMAALYLLMGAVGLMTAATTRLSGWKPVQAAMAAVGKLRQRRVIGWVLSGQAGLCCAGLAVFPSFDVNEKQLVTLRYWADAGRWTEYCDLVNREMALHPLFDPSKESKLTDLATVLLDNNRMLYHMGQLPEHLFSYPQLLGANSLLVTDSQFYLENHVMFLPTGDLLFEMGRVNEAERMFYEGWAFYGERASILWRLARLNLVKDRFEAARVFLNILKEVPFERAAAAQMERSMDQDPSLAWAPELIRIRNSDFTVDFPGTIYGPQDQLLAVLLNCHPENRMAFEYLMGYLLLTGHKEEVAKYVPACKRYGYPQLPRHYQEAVIEYVAERDLRELDLGGYTLNPETVRRFQEFRRLAAPCNGDTTKLWNTLAPGFADTYWFFEAMGGPGWGLKAGEPITMGSEPQ